MTEICVFVPVKFNVGYSLEVNDPENLEEIKDKLQSIDASDWDDDPQFYENLGDNFRDFIKDITKENIFLYKRARR
ncbi:MAG TPA: hypothetical protein ENH28_01645 [Euryarchaeota archaeon]|nr:hypothetical protein [Euryarchaeota archaeon]